MQHVTGALKELGCDDLRDHAAAVGMMKMAQPLLALKERYPGQLVVRVSLDHYSRSLHELERGPRSWGPAFAGLKWLIDEGFVVHVAGRRFSGEADAALRAGYARLFREHRLPIDADDPVQLILFPEMDATKDVPEITTRCWDIRGVSPDAIMCATSRGAPVGRVLHFASL